MDRKANNLQLSSMATPPVINAPTVATSDISQETTFQPFKLPSLKQSNMVIPLVLAGASTTAEGETDKETTFHPFPRLPVELQIKIWKKLIPKTPRIIKIRLHPRTSWSDSSPFFSTDTKASPLLRACKISRDEVLMVYNVCLESSGCKRKIRFDGVNDIMMFSNDEEDIKELLSSHRSEFPPIKTFSGVENYLCTNAFSWAFLWTLWRYISVKHILVDYRGNEPWVFETKDLWYIPDEWRLATKIKSNGKLERLCGKMMQAKENQLQKMREASQGATIPSFNYVSIVARNGEV
jgi:hypothetical protein